MERRTRVDVINDMLVTITEKGGKIKPTHLMYKANLSHSMMKGYLDELVEKEMVEEIKSDSNTYLIIKDRGLKFVEEFRKMNDFKEMFGI